MTWACKITKVENGYIFETMGTDPVSEVMEENATPEEIEYYKTSDEQKVALGKMLRRVGEHMAPMDIGYSKWNSDNLRITFDEKGSKVD